MVVHGFAVRNTKLAGDVVNRVGPDRNLCADIEELCDDREHIVFTGKQPFNGIADMCLVILLLDGGHFLIISIEGIIRRPLPLNVKLIIQQVGMLFLLGLVLFITIQDISRL